MNKTILYVVLLMILGIGVWYFIFSDKNSFGAGEADFRVKDTAGIYKIFLADKRGRSILLQRESDGWRLNNEHPALRSSINNLLTTLASQDAMRPVADNIHNLVVKDLAASGIKVELYGKNDKPMRIFYVGGQVGADAGSYMLMEGAEKSYVVQIPGFQGYLTPRYSTEFKDWRDRTVFAVPADQLQTVSLQYVHEDENLNSFVINRVSDEEFDVQVDPSLTQGKILNKRRVSVYTKYFGWVNCEGFLNGAPGLDSIIASAPKRCILEVADKKGRKQHVEIFWMRQDQRSKNLDTPDPQTPEGFDSDRFYATMNNFKDTMIIQRVSFDKILRRAFEFYEEDEVPSIIPDSMPSNTIRVNPN